MRRNQGRIVRYGAAPAFLLAAAVTSMLVGLEDAAVPLVIGGVVVAALLLLRAGHDDRGDRGNGGPGGGGRGDRVEGQPIPVRVRADRFRRR